MKPVIRLLPLVLLALCAACDPVAVFTVVEVCDPVPDSLEPASGPVAGGETVTLHGLHVGSELGPNDLVVNVGGQTAEVTGVFRGTGCGNCEACILDEEVFRCAECERVCRGERSWVDADGVEQPAEACEEWVSFVVPPATEPGPTSVQITNAHGSAFAADYTYE